METPDALVAAGAFWEAFKTEVRRIVAEWNRGSSSDDQVLEGPQGDHLLILYSPDRIGTSCTMLFALGRRDERELRAETKLTYAITIDDLGMQVGGFRSPQPLAAAVMEKWIGGMWGSGER